MLYLSSWHKYYNQSKNLPQGIWLYITCTWLLAIYVCRYNTTQYNVAIYVYHIILLQACGLHNQAITCGQLLKDKFVCFTSFPNDVYSYIACNPT